MKNIKERVCDWLVENQEAKLKEYFLADLSWADQEDVNLKEKMNSNGYATTLPMVVVNFFTKRTGKRVFEILPKDIKEYINNHIIPDNISISDS